jgi:hypothetical protein
MSFSFLGVGPEGPVVLDRDVVDVFYSEQGFIDLVFWYSHID